MTDMNNLYDASIVLRTEIMIDKILVIYEGRVGLENYK